MPTTRRQFIKQGAGMVTVSLVMPKLWLREARAQANPNRKIFVVIQLNGGNDGLNTLIPYSNSRYLALRPTIGFREAELKDDSGRSTVLNGNFGLHPKMGEIKELYDAGRVAIINGVGYPSPNLSHFVSTDIWYTGNINSGQGNGWLGKYADQELLGKSGLSAVSIGGQLPKAFFADQVVVPSIASFQAYTFQTDARYAGERNVRINLFNELNHRTFPAKSLAGAIADTGTDAVSGAQQVQASIAGYTSTVTYPANNPLASALKMVAQLITTVPEASLLYVSIGGFDNHSDQIGNQAEPTGKLVGAHATLLNYFSEGVKAFYDDMTQHGLADNVLMLEWSEFGRRPNENASRGTDHGTSSQMFIIGNAVRSGIYGEQPSLETTGLDQGGNMRFNVDFRAVYAEVVDRWLGGDSRDVLGSTFDKIGFLS